jgi:hypothetical protein
MLDKYNNENRMLLCPGFKVDLDTDALDIDYPYRLGTDRYVFDCDDADDDGNWDCSDRYTTYVEADKAEFPEGYSLQCWGNREVFIYNIEAMSVDVT